MKKITNKILLITLIIILLVNIIFVIIGAKKYFKSAEDVTIEVVDTADTNIITLEDTIVVE